MAYMSGAVFFGPATYGHVHEYGWSFGGDGEDVSTSFVEGTEVWSASWGWHSGVCARSWRSGYVASKVIS